MGKISVQLPNFEYSHLLAHTFPGFLLAISLFMALDVLSPFNLSFQVNTLSGLATLISFIIIIGTIFGVIIDGVHHIFIVPFYFNFCEINNLRICKNNGIPNCGNINISLFPFFSTFKDKAIETKSYLDKEYYFYSEFFANSSLSLLISSIIMTYYLFYIFMVPWFYSCSVGILMLIIASLTLYLGYYEIRIYEKSVLSAICSQKDMFNACSPRKINESVVQELAYSRLLQSFLSYIFWVLIF